jgi:hypothetical protein
MVWDATVDRNESAATSFTGSTAPGIFDARATDGVPFREAVASWERHLVEQAMMASHGNKSDAAPRLGIHRRLLYEKLAGLGIKWTETASLKTCRFRATQSSSALLSPRHYRLALDSRNSLRAGVLSASSLMTIRHSSPWRVNAIPCKAINSHSKS